MWFLITSGKLLYNTGAQLCGDLDGWNGGGGCGQGGGNKRGGDICILMDDSQCGTTETAPLQSNFSQIKKENLIPLKKKKVRTKNV